MSQQKIDHTGNEQWWRTAQRLNEMFAELYAADVASTASGEATSSSLTTAAGAQASVTITNASIAATSKVFVSVKNGTNSAGAPALVSVTPGSGSAVVVIQNIHASAAFNGTLKLEYFVVI